MINYKQYELIPTLQNAKIIEPEATLDRYYLDPKHTTIKIQANVGYTFENDGSLTYNKDELDQETLTIKATHSNTVTVTLPPDIDWSVQDDFELTMEAVKTETYKQYELIPTLQNAKIIEPEATLDKYYLDPKHTTIKIQANVGYTFENDGSLTYNKDELDQETLTIKATHSNTVTVTLPPDIDWSVQDDFELTMEAVKTETYKQYELIPTLQNAKIIEPEATLDKYYLDPKHTTIKIQANVGYTFENNGSLTYNKDELDQETLTITATHTNTVTVTLPTNIDWSVQDDFELTMGAVKSEIVENTGGFTNIYKADYTNLLKFSNEVILKITGGTGGVSSYDVTPYINNLVLLPFNVPSGEKSNIVAGNEIFKTQLYTVDNNYLNVNLGIITVPETYKNGYDYYNVTTRLMLPYTNMIELDPVHVINQTISIKYIVNVVNGDTTINLLNGDDLFYSEQVNLASEVPFISSANKGTQYAVINRLKTVFRNSINQAYIIIEQPTPILNSDYYPTNEKGTLKGYNGNVKCNLLNNMNINNNELNTLQKLLNNGVNIK